MTTIVQTNTIITVSMVQARLDKVAEYQKKLPHDVTSGDPNKDSEIKEQIYTFPTDCKIHDLNGDGKIDYNEFWEIPDKSKFYPEIERKSKGYKDPEALEKFKQSFNRALDSKMQLERVKIYLEDAKKYLSDK